MLEEHRYDFQLSIFHDQDPEPAYSRLAGSQGVDGLILYSPRLADQQIKKMEETTLPFVFCGRNPNLPEASFVDVDNVKLGYEGTAKLIEAGHSRIAFVHLSLAYQSYLERYQGYQKALGEYGLKEELLLLEGLDPQAAMIKSIKGGSTAFFLAHAGFAPLVYEAAKLTRRQIPAELSLIAADDLPLAPYLVPALSSFQIPHRELGKRAAEILMAKILGKEEERQVILPHTYIRRGSI